MKKIILAAVIFALSGCGAEVSFEEQSYEAAPEEVSSVIIDAHDRKITVSPSADGKVRLDYVNSTTEAYDLSLAEDGTLSLILNDEKEAGDYIGTKPPEEMREISLLVPESGLSSLEIATSNEDIALEKISADNLVLSSNGGSLNIDSLSVGKSAELSAKNGDINANIIGSWDDFKISAESKKGDCNLPAEKADGEKSLDVSCNNGDIAVDFVAE